MSGRDDRGRRVELLAPRAVHGLDSHPSTIPANIRSNILRAARRGSCVEQSLLSLFAIGLLCVGVPGTIGLVRSSAAAPGLSGASRLAMVGVLAVMCIVPVLVMFRRRGIGLQRAITLHGYCATCGYPLAGLPVASDGCTVCSECGSAWRIRAAKDV
jgi:hypothetical protein